jgi:hypothetical protein
MRLKAVTKRPERDKGQYSTRHSKEFQRNQERNPENAEKITDKMEG